MVKKSVDATETIVKYGPKVCSLGNAVTIVVCFLAVGLLAGFFVGHHLSLLEKQCEHINNQ